ncbi:MAG TPA: helix-turn-helix domain-containing protein [Rhizomicrobium sp.]|jgi:excisionase family DNA binding protein|nr:helix-turn-helix domain-containing protein [Rhizomicrobium sp.]
MSQELYSVDQVASLLGLHVKTVRHYVRDGKLKAVRIGKQYRIMREDLEALTGRSAEALEGPAVRRQRHVEVSSVVDIDAVDQDTAFRITTMLTSAVGGRPANDARVRIDTIYDAERARLKVIVSGSIETTRVLLGAVKALAER